MKLPKKLYVLVCEEWDGKSYQKSNIGIYSDENTCDMAAQYMQGHHKACDIKFYSDEVDFCEVVKK